MVWQTSTNQIWIIILIVVILASTIVLYFSPFVLVLLRTLPLSVALISEQGFENGRKKVHNVGIALGSVVVAAVGARRGARWPPRALVIAQITGGVQRAAVGGNVCCAHGQVWERVRVCVCCL